MVTLLPLKREKKELSTFNLGVSILLKPSYTNCRVARKVVFGVGRAINTPDQ